MRWLWIPASVAALLLTLDAGAGGHDMQVLIIAVVAAWLAIIGLAIGWYGAAGTASALAAGAALQTDWLYRQQYDLPPLAWTLYVGALAALIVAVAATATSWPEPFAAWSRRRAARAELE